MDHVEDAFRQAQLLINDLKDAGLGHGHLLRRLHDIRITRYDGIG
jgi:hypothetical protein